MSNPAEAQTFHRRVTVCRAVQVTHANLAAVAVWVKGSTWGASVILPGERVATVGDWVVQVGATRDVWTDETFTREWVPVAGLPPVGRTEPHGRDAVRITWQSGGDRG